jgi:hypothetical protein
MQPAPPTPAGRVLVAADAIQEIVVEGPDGSYTLTRTAATPEPRMDPDRPGAEPSLSANRLATVWELRSPLKDRVDPAKLRAVLTAIPEIWAESFVRNKTLAEAGLEKDKEERTLKIRKTNGQTAVIRIGKQSKEIKREEPQPPQANPFQPPPPRPPAVVETYAYAKFDDNPLMFEIRTDKLQALFTRPEELRDAALLRLETNEVTQLKIAPPGKPVIVLTRKKGNPNAGDPADRDDRWILGEGTDTVLAETAKVTELLDALSRLEAKNPPSLIPGLPAPAGADKAIVDNPEAKKLTEMGFTGKDETLITLTTQLRVPDGETPPPAKTTVVKFGKNDVEKKKLHVMVDTWPRVNVVADDVVKLVDRPALAYRGRRLFDTAEAKLDAVVVKGDTVTGFTLKQEGASWKITAPMTGDTDDAKAGQFTGDFARLEATEYVNDAPKPEELEKYGLVKPRLTVNLSFTGKDAKPAVITIGNTREGKPEAYAQLNGKGSVFTIPTTIVESLDKGLLGLLPLPLWTTTSDTITQVDIQRGEEHGKETFRLKQDGAQWKISGPFEATAGFANVQGVLVGLSNVKAEKYESLKVEDPAKYGFDSPTVKFTLTYKESKPGVEAAKADAVVKTVLVGKVADTTTNTRYATLEGPGGATVFTVAESVVKAADQGALDFLDKQVLTIQPQTIQSVVLAGTDGITLTKNDKGTWKAEGLAFVPDQPTLDALLQSASMPKVNRIAAYGQTVKWDEYGLDKPIHTITVTVAPPMGDANAKPTTHTILLGRTDTTGDRFARVDNGPAVLVLAGKSAEALAKTKLDFADRTLLTFDSASLNGIVRKKGAAELELLPNATGSGWDLVKPAPQKADTETLNDLADQMGRLRASRVAAFAPKDLKPFGLDTPVATITLKVGLENPTEKVLKLGGLVDPSKPEGDRYAMVETKGDTTVAVLAAAMANRLLAEPIKFRDRAMNPVFRDADRATLVRGDRTVTFAKVNGTWKMTAPLETDAEVADLEELTGALASLRADELVADTPGVDLNPYGLTKPVAVWTLYSNDKETLKLSLGKTDAGRVYAKTSAGDLVGLLNTKLTERVLGEYRKRTVWSGVDAAQVDLVTVKAGANEFKLQKAGMAWIDPAKPTDIPNTAKVTEFLDSLAGLKAERYVVDQKADLKLYGLEPPVRTISVTLKDGTTKVLHVGREEGGSNGERVYARVADKDRTEVFVLSAADTVKLLRDRSGFRP